MDRMFLEPVEVAEMSDWQKPAVNKKRVEPLALSSAGHVGVESFARFDERRQDLERSAFHRGLELAYDRGDTLFFHRQIAIRAKLRAGFREKQAQKMINFGDRSDR